MKKIDTNKSKEELHAAMIELKANIQKMQFELAEKKLNNPMQIRQAKKDIARILTALNK